MESTQREVLQVLLEGIYAQGLLSRSAYDAANHLVHSELDLPDFFRHPVCRQKEDDLDGSTQDPRGNADGQTDL